MKSIQLLFVLFLSMFLTNNSFAQEANTGKKTKLKTETFTVYGNCGICKRTIEGSLTDVKGVSFAEWNKDTHVMTVEYKPKKISLDEIKQKITAAGYDTDTYRAETDVYESLPGCCQYERPASPENK